MEKENVFVTGPGTHDTYLVVGEKKKRDDLLEAYKNGWARNERVMYVEVEVAPDAAAQGATVLFYNFWTKVVAELKEQIPAYTADEEDLYVDIMEEYQKIEETSPEDGLDHTKIFNLLSMFTEYNVQVVLVVKEFQNTAMETDKEGFFAFLFDISPKQAEYNLTILLLSEESAETVAEPHMVGGSRFTAAYTQSLI